MSKQAVNLFVTFVVGLALGITAHAYFQPCGGPPSVQEKLDFFARRLRLSNEQKSQVETIFTNYRPEIQAVHNEFRPQFDAVRSKIDADIRTLLTPKQRILFEELQKEMEQKRKERDQRRGFDK